MSETKKVKDLRSGSSVDSTFLVLEKELKEFISKEGYYRQVKLGDSTGSIWGKCWEKAEEVAVVALCETISGLYPELGRDLLLAGAILHDIGKTAAYEYAFRIDVTEEGGQMDHIVLGYRMVEEKIKEIKN